MKTLIYSKNFQSYQVPQNEFEKHEKCKPFKDQNEDENDNFGLEDIESFCDYSTEDPDTDLGLNVDNDNNDNDEEKNDTDQEFQHPWIKKKMKIVTSDDIELSLDKLQKKAGVINKHIMISYAITVITPPHLQHKFPPVILYRGEKAEEKLVQELANLKEEIEDLWEKEGNMKMIPLTDQQEQNYHLEPFCHICSEPITFHGSMQEWQDQCIALKQKNPPTKNANGTIEYQTRFRPHFKKETDKLGPRVRDHDHW